MNAIVYWLWYGTSMFIQIESQPYTHQRTNNVPKEKLRIAVLNEQTEQSEEANIIQAFLTHATTIRSYIDRYVYTILLKHFVCWSKAGTMPFPSNLSYFF